MAPKQVSSAKCPMYGKKMRNFTGLMEMLVRRNKLKLNSKITQKKNSRSEDLMIKAQI